MLGALLTYVYTDQDECAYNIDQCDDNYGLCHNTKGSYYCSCIGGFKLTTDGHSCTGSKNS